MHIFHYDSVTSLLIRYHVYYISPMIENNKMESVVWYTYRQNYSDTGHVYRGSVLEYPILLLVFVECSYYYYYYISLLIYFVLQWFSPGTPFSSNNKTDRHDITEILLKVVLSIITHYFVLLCLFHIFFVHLSLTSMLLFIDINGVPGENHCNTK
jgi:hypothetical protein